MLSWFKKGLAKTGYWRSGHPTPRETDAPPLILQWSKELLHKNTPMITQSIQKYQHHLYCIKFDMPSSPQKMGPTLWPKQNVPSQPRPCGLRHLQVYPPRRPLASEKAWCSYSARLVLFGKGYFGRIVIFRGRWACFFATERVWFLVVYMYPNDPCFQCKGPSFGGFKPQNRGQTGSRYTLVFWIEIYA